jgi:Mrp family chromosome partitioning ATPase
MGLFTAATLKANQPELKAHQPEQPRVLSKSANLACGISIAPELENSLDVLWSRLRSRPSAATGATAQAFLVTHWEPDEGASTLATALAYRAAQIDPTRTFCLADFDLFNSGLSFLTDLEAEPGVSNVLLGQVALEEVLATTPLPNLCVLPAGYPTIGRHVTQVVDRCQELCELLVARFNYVMLDTPCLRQHPNFAFWASGLAQAVLVVRAGQARQPTVAKAIQTLQLMRLEVAGVVLNAREYHVPKWLYSRT